ncbi:MAG TPA: hypothetical protein VFP05_12490 [Thermomicrobiales bacterium]|nr:hypothetical protein [Thermomicrobiales bacterium]
MVRMRWIRALALLVTLVGMMGFSAARAQDATPEAPIGTPEAVTASSAPVELELVDQSRNVNTVDFGNDGLTPGDLIVWGPDPLYSADDLQDTGSVTYGSCVMVNTDGDCMAQETFIFADGSTLEVQGLEFGATKPSVKTITGGSGIFLGATGTLTDIPDANRTTWTKHIEYWPGPNAPVQ